MAGGLHAAIVPCTYCSGKAIRLSEGIETDWYECTACERRFLINWESAGGPPAQPCWPPSEEYMAERRRWSELLGSLRTRAPEQHHGQTTSLWSRTLALLRSGPPGH